MLPAVKPGIDGPRAGPDQRQGNGKHHQYGAIPDMGRGREGDPRFGARGHNSGHGRPQTGDEEDTGEASNNLRRRKLTTLRRDRAVHQSTADQQSLNQKSGARRTARERGEQPLHMYPNFSLRESQQFRNIRKYERPTPLWGASRGR